ncbi:zinc ABC transporter substrate-binding protein AztC [Nocardiopsis sediminis]|uniref:Zinc ABC transporter substrate-binding protein AztC n=1 Tax=Nocardiopsis sediminis TaxID=1778267 RepID=A0ABV8FMW0_9ACTN
MATRRNPPRRTPRPLLTMAAAATAGLLAAAAGCAATGPERQGVVVTTNILGDITREIVGDQADVTVLMKPGADPHSFGISAQEAALIERSALVVYNGLGLEEGVLRNVHAAEDAGVATLAVGDEVDPVAFTPDDAADMAGEPDPHFWTDPRRVATAVDAIAERVIAEVDGVDAQAVRDNAADYRGDVEELDAWVTERVAAIPADRRSLVTDHHVFGYFAQRYGFEVIGAVVPSGTTLASPSAADLESLAGSVRDAGVPAIFADSAQPDRLAQVLADEAGVHVEVVALHAESLTDADGGAPTYLEMVRSNTDAIADGLSGG